ncbi:MAG: InlB B-repeat-containing protein, partial [Clostridia bacterium]|nr:InlB B-repeat-containing protein [Clostridia bacterium]
GLHRDEGVVCNYFEVPGKVMGGWQCCGFLRLMTYLYFGVSFENWDTSASLTGIKAGDVLYLTSGGPHYIWVLSVTDNGDGTQKITYNDCNGAGRRVHCQIQWDARCTVNMATGELELAAIGTWDIYKRYISPGGARAALPDSYTMRRTGFTVTYSDGQGKSDPAASVAGDLTLKPCSFRRPGYTFAGWTIRRVSDGAWLRGNEWKTGASAGSATRFQANATLSSSLFAGDDASYTVIAAWTVNRLTVRYAPNGGRFSDAAYALDADTGVIIQTATGKPLQNEWTYTSLTGRETTPDPEEWGLMCPGYTFVGWSVGPRNKIVMTATEIAARLSRKSGEETWYAVWVPNMVKVWYRTDAGVVDSDNYQLLSNGRICRRDHTGWAITRLFYNAIGATLPTAEDLGLTREGYTFVGWTKNGETAVSESSIKRMATAQFRVQVELTAMWEENKS